MARLALVSLVVLGSAIGAAHAQPAPGSAPESAEPAPPAAPAVVAEPAVPVDQPGPPTPDLAPPPEPPVAPPPEAPRWFERVTLTGLVDSYVAVPLRGSVTAPQRLRVFDGAGATLGLAYAELAVSVPAEPAGVRLDLGFGPVADLASLEPTTDAMGQPAVGASEVTKHVQQAYASWKLPFDRAIVVDAGKFVTTAGAEVIEAKDNWLYSRSLLFGYAIPFTHTGVRVTAAATDQVSVQAMVVNGWDVGLADDRHKSFAASVLYAGGDVTGALTAIVGREAADVRTVIDAVATVTAGALAVNANVDVGIEGDARWYGAAVQARYELSDRVRASARVEHFRDPQGARTAIVDGVTVSEGTAGAAVRLGDGGELRLEGRVDRASAAIFDGGSRWQSTITAAALAWF